MFSKEVVVMNQVGLRARPATFFTQKANEFKCSVWIQKDERKAKARRAASRGRSSGAARGGARSARPTGRRPSSGHGIRRIR